jgi:phospholipase/lecithinase/hemolysin
MKQQLLAAGFFLVSLGIPTKAFAASFSQFFIFGDSLSDTGNVFTATGGLTNPQKAIPPSPPYAPGRFSNGKVWVDYAGEQFKLNPIPSAAIQTGIIPRQGVNFAIGGAETGFQSTFPGTQFNIPGVLSQVGLFSQNFPVADPNALYAVFAGANDYFFNVNPNVNKVVQNLSVAVGTLAQAGAKNIVVFNLPNLGETPFSRVRGTSQQLNNLTKQHNTQLAVALQGLRSTNPNVNLTSVDINSLFDLVRGNPTRFGLKDVTNPCVIGDATNIISACSNPDDFLFFDAVHPTTKVHDLIAKGTLASIAGKSIPEPSSVLSLLALGALGTFALKRKQVLSSSK